MARAAEHRQKYRHGMAHGAFAVSLALALAGCVTDGPKDKSGQTLLVSPIEARGADQTDLNIGMFIDPRGVAKVERKLVNYTTISERTDLKGVNGSGNGFINTQRGTETWFGLGTIGDIDDVEKFNAKVKNYFKTTYTSHTPAQKVDGERSFATVGYKTIATVGAATCFVGSVAYRFGMLTVYTNERRLPDTIVDVVYCRPKADYADFDLLMNKLAVMKPEEAAQIRAKLPGKTG